MGKALASILGPGKKYFKREEIDAENSGMWESKGSVEEMKGIWHLNGSGYDKKR